MQKRKIAVVGAGIYGATIAVKLAKLNFDVTMFDPLGLLRAASTINQLRVHKGYHYPRSPETIREILESRVDFIEEYKESIVQGIKSYYAIPHNGSRTSVQDYKRIYEDFGMKLEEVSPKWMDFDFIDSCFLVDEDIYDPNILREIVRQKIIDSNVLFEREKFTDDKKDIFDFVIYATYGVFGDNKYLVNNPQIQVAEKILIELPNELKNISLVVVDGPFTAFDPYGETDYFQFGGALHTNHWKSKNINDPIPEKYKSILNLKEFKKVDFTNFEKMRRDSSLSVPLCKKAKYLGSKFTIRLVENDPKTDSRLLHIKQTDDKTIHVFSGKVVGAMKAADIISKMVTEQCK